MKTTNKEFTKSDRPETGFYNVLLQRIYSKVDGIDVNKIDRVIEVVTISQLKFLSVDVAKYGIKNDQGLACRFENTRNYCFPVDAMSKLLDAADHATFKANYDRAVKELQSQNERMFLLTFLVLNTGKTEQELENNVFQANSIAQKHNCNLIRLNFQQEQGLMSSLPLAYNEIEIQRGMTTSSTAIFVPFTTQELFQAGDEALYYGLNALSNNLIMVDRKKLKNPNGLILGTPGAGKSFSAKR